jgi:hypothetical protein
MAQPKRPKALTDLIALLDETGWSYAVQHGRDSADAAFTTVQGRPRWDPYTEIQAIWHTRDTGTLRLRHCKARQIYRGWFDLTLTAARELVTPEPNENGEGGGS